MSSDGHTTPEGEAIFIRGISLRAAGLLGLPSGLIAVRFGRPMIRAASSGVIGNRLDGLTYNPPIRC